MKTTQFYTVTLAAAALAMIAPSPVRADPSAARLVRTLRGELHGAMHDVRGAVRDASQVIDPHGRLSTRVRHNPIRQILPRRSLTRSLQFQSRSHIPYSLRGRAASGCLSISTAHGGGASCSVSYHVDPASRVVRQDILFRKGSTEFADARSYDIVMDLAYAISDPALDGMSFVIEGHASAEGNAYANQRLSQRRAERIASEIARTGVSSHRLIPVGYGETEATYPDYSSERHLRLDRRVVIYRLDS